MSSLLLKLEVSNFLLKAPLPHVGENNYKETWNFKSLDSTNRMRIIGAPGRSHREDSMKEKELL